MKYTPSAIGTRVASSSVSDVDRYVIIRNLADCIYTYFLILMLLGISNILSYDAFP
jgi:hypothetical protein